LALCSFVSFLGEVYKKQSCQSSNPITLLLSSDGKPTIKSSKCSIWPVSISSSVRLHLAWKNDSIKKVMSFEFNGKENVYCGSVILILITYLCGIAYTTKITDIYTVNTNSKLVAENFTLRNACDLLTIFNTLYQKEFVFFPFRYWQASWKCHDLFVIMNRTYYCYAFGIRRVLQQLINCSDELL
jgi:hypothetical protein